LSTSSDDSAEELVDFDEVADRLRRMVTEVSAGPDQVATSRVGGFGTVTSVVATPLAMALTELLQNAAEHGFGPDARGTVVLRVERGPERLRVSVEDDGRGLSEDFVAETSPSLGLSIVRTLVAELGGSLRIARRDDGPGTVAVLDVPL
jgi:two-component sensor histidine kinase